jgi:uncharacterized protein YycO
MFGAGHFSHCDIVLPDGTLLGARSDTIGGKPPGVQIRPDDYEVWSFRVRFTTVCTDKQAADFYDFASAQVGKPYDKLAIFAFVINRNWRDEDAWFCDELDIRCYEVSGLLPIVYTPANKITPVSAATLVSAVAQTTWQEFGLP